MNLHESGSRDLTRKNAERAQLKHNVRGMTKPGRNSAGNQLQTSGGGCDVGNPRIVAINILRKKE
jgi:hypothetical protein